MKRLPLITLLLCASTAIIAQTPEAIIKQKNNEAEQALKRTLQQAMAFIRGLTAERIQNMSENELTNIRKQLNEIIETEKNITIFENHPLLAISKIRERDVQLNTISHESNKYREESIKYGINDIQEELEKLQKSDYPTDYAEKILKLYQDKLNTIQK